MYRYFIEMAYNGGRYNGWQIQPNAPTVQEIINDAMQKVLRQDINVAGCGRTDTGVHASYFVAHFDSEEVLDNPGQVVYRLNRIVGNDIVVYSIQKVENDTHSRFHAVSRTYHYYLCNVKNPFANSFSYRPYYNFDVDRMNEAARVLLEYEDFTSFSKLHADTKTNNCKIMAAGWIYQDDGAVFIIKADRFLRNMVRAIVGTLLEVGRGKINIDDFRKIIEQQDRSAAGTSVPPQALFLVDIEYPEKIFKRTVRKYPPLYNN